MARMVVILEEKKTPKNACLLMKSLKLYQPIIVGIGKQTIGKETHY